MCIRDRCCRRSRLLDEYRSGSRRFPPAARMHRNPWDTGHCSPACVWIVRRYRARRRHTNAQHAVSPTDRDTSSASTTLVPDPSRSLCKSPPHPSAPAISARSPRDSTTVQLRLLRLRYPCLASPCHYSVRIHSGYKNNALHPRIGTKGVVTVRGTTHVDSDSDRADIIYGGAEGARTPDLNTASVALSQLSYSPVISMTSFADATMSTRCSITGASGEG